MPFACSIPTKTLFSSLQFSSWRHNWFARSTWTNTHTAAMPLQPLSSSSRRRHHQYLDVSPSLIYEMCFLLTLRFFLSFYFMIGLFSAVYFSPAHKIRIQCMNEKLDLTLYSVRLKICKNVVQEYQILGLKQFFSSFPYSSPFCFAFVSLGALEIMEASYLVPTAFTFPQSRNT